jgi:hypothetical protein
MPHALCPMPNPSITLLSFTLYLFDFSEIWETDGSQVFDSFASVIEKSKGYVIICNVYLIFVTL